VKKFGVKNVPNLTQFAFLQQNIKIHINKKMSVQ